MTNIRPFESNQPQIAEDAWIDETVVVIGDGVTLGHRVLLHSCEIGDGCFIGMDSTILDGAVL